MGLMNAGLPNTTGGGDRTKSIQRGVSSVGTNTTLAVTVSTVNTAKALTTFLGGSGAAANLVYIALTGPSTLSITNKDVSNTAVVSWELREIF